PADVGGRGERAGARRGTVLPGRSEPDRSRAGRRDGRAPARAADGRSDSQAQARAHGLPVGRIPPPSRGGEEATPEGLLTEPLFFWENGRRAFRCVAATGDRR